MSAPKFTPWRACFPAMPSGRRYFPHVHLGERPRGIRECGGADITVNEGGETMEEVDACARLIAAAPDLYEALAELRDAWCLNACDAASPDEGVNHLPECEKASAALKKARP